MHLPHKCCCINVYTDVGDFAATNVIVHLKSDSPFLMYIFEALLVVTSGTLYVHGLRKYSLSVHRGYFRYFIHSQIDEGTS